jgi:hypothetical protein
VVGQGHSTSLGKTALALGGTLTDPKWGTKRTESMANDSQTYSEQLDELFKSHFEQHFKNANLLLVAHGGALLACLTVLREYSNMPRLHGIGIVIGIECLGMIAAILGYGCLSVGYLHLSARPHLKSKYEAVVPKLMNLVFGFQLTALGTLVLTIAIVGIRLLSL